MNLHSPIIDKNKFFHDSNSGKFWELTVVSIKITLFLSVKLNPLTISIEQIQLLKITMPMDSKSRDSRITRVFYKNSWQISITIHRSSSHFLRNFHSHYYYYHHHHFHSIIITTHFKLIKLQDQVWLILAAPIIKRTKRITKKKWIWNSNRGIPSNLKKNIFSNLNFRKYFIIHPRTIWKFV